jgi:hypothetical protein
MTDNKKLAVADAWGALLFGVVAWLLWKDGHSCLGLASWLLCAYLSFDCGRHSAKP